MKYNKHYNDNNLYIAGEWLKGSYCIKNINPSDTKDCIGEFSQADEKQTQQAIQAAKLAQIQWQETSLEHKQNVLDSIAQDLIDNTDYLGEILSREEGKPLAEGKGEIYRSAQFFKYYAAEVLRQIGETADSVRPGVGIEINREPVGVIGVISPWNFPTAVAAWKIAPALAFGNAVVWKPSNLTPASAVELAKIIAKQDIPAGLFNLVLGSGSLIGETIINSKDIGGITFTGSVDVGRHIASASTKNFVKCQLEMGSKNALVIADDADIDVAITSAIAGSFSGAGQKCTASSRIIVTEAIHDKFVDLFSKKVNELKIGHALDKNVFMGPVVDENQLKSNLKWVKRAKELGGEMVCGDKELSIKYDGYYMPPVIFANTKNNWDINQKEIFAPMTCIIKVKDIEEAIATSNDTEFGLSAGIITTSLKNSSLFKQKAQAGCVMINLPTAGTDYHVPFGGRKQSSFGVREQGQYAREFYTIVKTIYQKPF